jgi:hypothetical protein
MAALPVRSADATPLLNAAETAAPKATAFNVLEFVIC